MYKDTIPDSEIVVSLTKRHDLARRLVPENQRRFALHVPAHDIAGTDSTYMRAYQCLTSADLGSNVFFDTNVVDRIEPRDAQCSASPAGEVRQYSALNVFASFESFEDLRKFVESSV